MSDAPKSKFELIVELVRALAWPLFATIALIVFLGPLRLTARQIPDLVGRSETITVAGLSIEVQRGVSQQASDEVKQAVADLSPDSISLLLNMQGASYFASGYGALGRQQYAELIDLGLVVPLPTEELPHPISESGEVRKYDFGIDITPLGEDAQSFLLSLISEFVQELRSAEQID